MSHNRGMTFDRTDAADLTECVQVNSLLIDPVWDRGRITRHGLTD
jgi:hypothetical protein